MRMKHKRANFVWTHTVSIRFSISFRVCAANCAHGFAFCCWPIGYYSQFNPVYMVIQYSRIRGLIKRLSIIRSDFSSSFTSSFWSLDFTCNVFAAQFIDWLWSISRCKLYLKKKNYLKWLEVKFSVRWAHPDVWFSPMTFFSLLHSIWI